MQALTTRMKITLLIHDEGVSAVRRAARRSGSR
jgi:hypothetical protein